ncbi:MAG: hypothetical protein LBN27_03455 [Prevotellaceae bacterium]|jgi:hypothetical protein|nr:hypothetical protein [Prevotellaceae bacterium]
MNKLTIGSIVLLTVVYVVACKPAPNNGNEQWETIDSVSPLQQAAVESIAVEIKNERKSALLSEIDLAIIRLVEEEHTGVVPENVLSLQLIPQSEFNDNYTLNNEFLLRDTLAVHKENGVTKLPCKMQTIVFKDNADTDGDDYAAYSYIGQIEFLNVYLMSGNYYEWGEYFFVDKTTGETIAAFNDMPMISHNKKYIADIFYNPYENETEFNVYAIDAERKFPRLCNYYFTKWGIYEDWNNSGNENYCFWGENDNLYACAAATRYMGEQWNEKHTQYVRIKLNF